MIAVKKGAELFLPPSSASIDSVDMTLFRGSNSVRDITGGGASRSRRGLALNASGRARRQMPGHFRSLRLTPHSCSSLLALTVLMPQLPDFFLAGWLAVANAVTHVGAGTVTTNAAHSR